MRLERGHFPTRNPIDGELLLTVQRVASLFTHVTASLPALLHRQTPEPEPWRWVPWVLALAFLARAAIALSNDFVLHPDEIMQYLEPAHWLVFGNGVKYWEYFYGARSWLIPGAIGGILKSFDAVGLGQPWWYVPGVKLALCAISLAIPAAMYVFARRHFGEYPARVALLAGAFWYELAGFAHKPMAEFLATAPFMGLLALAVRPSVDDRVWWWGPVLAVLTAALRMQYAPLAAALLVVLLLRARRRMPILLATAGMLLAVGVFDAVTWNGGLFPSYAMNLRLNLVVAPYRAEESPPWMFFLWFALASGGIWVIAVLASLRNLRRYGFVLALTALALILHSAQGHKEYRFVFVLIPLWLMLGADVVAHHIAEWTAHRRCFVARIVAMVFLSVSLAGILNLLPYQELVYFAWSGETGHTHFVRREDSQFAAYRYLAGAAGVKSVWHRNRGYAQTPGYYYLHRKIPFYSAFAEEDLIPDETAALNLVSHIVTNAQSGAVSGYVLEKDFGSLHVLRRSENGARVPRWRSYAPIMINEFVFDLVRRIDPTALAPPPNAGIRFLCPVPSDGVPEDRTGCKGYPAERRWDTRESR